MKLDVKDELFEHVFHKPQRAKELKNFCVSAESLMFLAVTDGQVRLSSVKFGDVWLMSVCIFVSSCVACVFLFLLSSVQAAVQCCLDWKEQNRKRMVEVSVWGKVKVQDQGHG